MAFGDALAALDEALQWLDELPGRWPAPVAVAPDEALGWRAVGDLRPARPVPGRRCAARSGVALASAASEGAGVYNPLRLSLVAGEARFVRRGEPLAQRWDAVLHRDEAVLEGSTLVLVAPVTPGTGVAEPGAELPADASLLAAGQRLTALDCCRLAGAGVEALEAHLPPQVQVVAADPEAGPAARLLAAALAADGARAQCAEAAPAAALEAFADGGASALLVLGEAADVRALAGAGELAFPALAIRPGEGSGLGALGGAPLALLPAQPWPALMAYHLLLRSWLRRAAGLPGVPGRRLAARRKLTSSIGLTEALAVALDAGGAYPLARDPSLPPASLAGVVRIADGSEGYAPGAEVLVESILESLHCP